METLLEFIQHTKANSYVAAVLLMVAFVPVWRFLTEREPKKPHGHQG